SNISIKSAVSLKESIADLCKRDDLSDEQQVVQRCVDDMISDLERVLQFYRNKEVGNKVDHIFVIGGSAKMRGLVEYMEQKLGVATSYIEQLENVELSSDCKVLGMPEYFNAIGAMIRL
ncbi:MAG TPA: hypothetical protein DCY20_05320, partial [Firmicutes bacterium]|nr:hypothetical protein [Bacillota bacterium]